MDYGDGQTQSYNFDAMGNRASKTDVGGGLNGTENYTVNNANMLLTRGSANYTNDADGSTLTDPTHTNTWDSENRLATCVTTGANAATSNFVYGSDGIRHSSTITTGGTTTSTNFVLDASMFIREQRAGVNYATYLVGARGPEYRRQDSGANAGQVRWYVYDGLGSVLAEVDPNGNITSKRKYDVYGLVRNAGVAGDNAGGTSSHKFVGSLGHASEDNTGYVYMRARYMDPQTGRFVSEDPILSGKNWFAYCGNNATNATDPTGKCVGVLIEGGIEAAEGIRIAGIGLGALFSVLIIIAGVQAFQSLVVGSIVLMSNNAAESEAIREAYRQRFGRYPDAATEGKIHGEIGDRKIGNGGDTTNPDLSWDQVEEAIAMFPPGSWSGNRGGKRGN